MSLSVSSTERLFKIIKTLNTFSINPPKVLVAAECHWRAQTPHVLTSSYAEASYTRQN